MDDLGDYDEGLHDEIDYLEDDSCPECGKELHLVRNNLVCKKCGYGQQPQKQGFFGRLYGFMGTLFNMIASHSKIYRDLETGAGIDRLRTQLLEIRAAREARTEYVHADAMLEERVRIAETNMLAERVLREKTEEQLQKLIVEKEELAERVALSMPVPAFAAWLDRFQHATLVFNPENISIIANKEAYCQLVPKLRKSKAGRVQLKGRDLWDMTSGSFVGYMNEKVMEAMQNGTYTFDIEPKGLFYGWHVGLITQFKRGSAKRIINPQDEELWGYIMSNERGFVAKLISLFAPASTAARKLREEGAIPESGLLFPAYQTK